MTKRIFLYTPWQEQGLSYDAKVIENLFLANGYEIIITYRTRKKIQWECEFQPISAVPKIIQPDDIFFSFEVFPVKYLPKIKGITDNIFHMVNYEFYEPDLNPLLTLCKTIFCKSRIAYEGLLSDGLNQVSYQPWILHEFPISSYRPHAAGTLNVLFNGGTGGYKERRNLEAIIHLINDYHDNDVHFTIKLTKKIQRWSRFILKRSAKMLTQDSRVTIIQENYKRDDYINFLNKFDINLAPSKFEGFGLTLLEALHANLPTLTLDISPLNEIIRHGETGICIPAKQIDLLRNQPIYQADRIELLEGFTQLVKDRTKLTQYKKNLSTSVKLSIDSFNSNMEAILFE